MQKTATVRNIYLEPIWKQPLSSQSLLQHPPEGYRFVTSETSTERGVQLAARLGFSYTVQEWLHKLLPLWLLKAYLLKFRPPPPGTALIWAIVHPVFREQPWVLDLQCEQPYLMVGGERHFGRYGKVLARALSSSYCRAIICAAEAGKRAFISIMGEGLGAKVSVVYPAIPPRNFVKTYNEDKVRILFVNSGNISSALHFDTKGGKELVEAFAVLSRKYPNLELVIRSSISPEMKERCLKQGNIKVIDRRIPWAELEQEWKTADIFLLPTRVTPFMVFLDAMSYELPIVTTDVWGNDEFVQQGRTGYLVPKSDSDQYIKDSVVMLNSPEYERSVKGTDQALVQSLIEKTGQLIENSELRRQMGVAGRREIEHGRFSFAARNANLKRIFDAATTGKASL